MRVTRGPLFLCLSLAVVTGGLLKSPTARAADDRALVEQFEKEVRPILANRCQSCHGKEKQKGGLRLDSRTAALTGGDTGPAIAPGDAKESLLVQAIHYGEELKMPPKSKLSPQEIATLTRWVEQGAVWPGDRAESSSASNAFDLKERAKHWSFQPIRVGEPPAVQHAERVSTPIDRFLLRELENKSLGYAPEADRATLIRRLTFDLTGLPPTPAEIVAFETDKRTDAYQRLVERLLASPQYGERWGRKWLDLVRFAETAGHEFDYDIPFAWRYRDYVVRAFNDDVPYDQFVLEHLAGDLLANPRLNKFDRSNESVQGTGFFLLGEGTHSPVDVREEQQRRTDNQIEVFGKAFLSLTVACARCHDHKFDPIAQKDYYALAGIIESSRHQYAGIDDDRDRKVAIAAIRKAKDGQASLDRTRFDAELKRLENELKSAAPSASTAPLAFEKFDNGFEDWSVSGEAFGANTTQPGDRRMVGNRLFAVPTGWAHSGLIADRLSGVIRSKSFKIEHPFVQLRLVGNKGLVQVAVDGFEKNRSPIYGGLIRRIDNADKPQWLVIDVAMWRGHNAYLEIADGGVADFEGAHTAIGDGSGFVAIDEIRFADSPTPEGAEPGAFPRAFGPAKDEPFAAWASRIAGVIETGCTDGSARGLIDWAAERQLISEDLGKPGEAHARLALIQANEQKLIPLRLVPALAEGTGQDAALLIRGQSKTPGAAVPRRFLEVLSGSQQPRVVSGSGRLELAQRVLAPSNPFLARSIVNRIWKGHFGEGLVRSMDDFGVMGEKPSHPELLDWLAVRLVKEKWSIKQIHRLLVNSSAYRMSSRVSDAGVEATDPDNRLLHRANLRRMEAEEVRDAILALSGRLDLTLGGPAVAPHLTPFMEGRGRPGQSGPLDGQGRRSLYLNVRRNFLSPLLLVFDYPTPATAIGRRNVSNVPAQALTLLNDPFVLDQAKRWARRELANAGTNQARVVHAYLAATGRRPSQAELETATAFLRDVEAEQGVDTAWAELCHGLINTKAFLFIE